jgi:hypothetical protein
MERDFDHSQKILLAVEFGTAPRTLPGRLPGYAIFQRLEIPEVVRPSTRTRACSFVCWPAASSRAC